MYKNSLFPGSRTYLFGRFFVDVEKVIEDPRIYM